MSKRLFIFLMLPLILLFCNSSQNSVAGSKQKSLESQTGTLEKMIVADGSVSMGYRFKPAEWHQLRHSKIGDVAFRCEAEFVLHNSGF